MYLEMIDSIRNVLNPLLEDMQLVLVDLTVRRYNQDFYIEIIADRPRGGITLEECSMLNRRLNDRMDQDNLIADNYFIEVSSPGLDRPLATREDLLRVLGRKLHFYLTESVHNKQEHEGVLKDVSEDQAYVVVNGQEISIPLDRINRALQVIRN